MITGVMRGLGRVLAEGFAGAGAFGGRGCGRSTKAIDELQTTLGHTTQLHSSGRDR